MKAFIQRHRASVSGVLHGFDRLRIRGTKRLLASAGGMFSFLWHKGVLLKEFGDFAQSSTDRIRRATERLAEAAGHPIQYLMSSSTDKEEVARRVMEKERITEGPICILSSVEPCWSYEIYRNRQTRKLELRSKWRKCLHYYHYCIHPRLGFMNLRLQTWFPFSSGAPWPARELYRRGGQRPEGAPGGHADETPDQRQLHQDV